MDERTGGSEGATLKKGAEVVLHAESAAFEGGCVARHEGMAVFVSGCVPGDTVRARIHKKRKRHAEARALEVLEPSPVRVEPPCIYFGDCGGCKWQNLAYAEQLRWKRQHVVDAFQRIGGLADVEVRPTIGCAEEYFYRNKMEFSFGDQRWLSEREIASGVDLNRDFALGLHVPGRFDKVLDVHRCWLQSELSNRIVNATRSFALEHGLSIYNTHTHSGLLRNLVIRQSRASGETMVILVTSDDADDVIEAYAEMVRSTLPEVTTLLQEDADAYTWAAAAIGSQSASGFQLASDEPVMAIGGFNGSDPAPTLEEFQQRVADGDVHWFIASSGGGPGGMGGPGGQRGGSSASSEISSWVQANFTATTVDGITLYDLTSPT